jgi:hypothetical protein
MIKTLNKDKILQFTSQLKSFKWVIFLGFIVLVYGLILLRASQLGNAKPNQATIAAESKSLNYPHINPATINSINTLQNNSVNVQSLFNQARQNPFQE